MKLKASKFHVRFKYKHVLGIFIYVQVVVYTHNLSDVKFTSFKFHVRSDVKLTRPITEVQILRRLVRSFEKGNRIKPKEMLE